MLIKCFTGFGKVSFINIQKQYNEKPKMSECESLLENSKYSLKILKSKNNWNYKKLKYFYINNKISFFLTFCKFYKQYSDYLKFTLNFALYNWW